MRKSLKFISLLLVMMFLIAGTTALISYADDPVDDPGGNNGNQQQQQGEPVDNPGNTPVEDPGNTPVEDPGNTPAENPGNTPVEDPGTQNENGNSGNTGYDSGNGYENNYSDNANTVQDTDPISYGYDTAPSNEVVTSDSVVSNQSLVKTPSKSNADIAPEKWSDVTIDNKTVKNDSGDINFSSIKNNTSKGDDSQWMLYLAYVLIGLSVLGIIVFIVDFVVSGNAAKEAARMERRRAAAGRPAYATAGQPQYSSPSAQRRTSHFSSDDNARPRRASSKADTGEVYVPRHASRRR